MEDVKLLPHTLVHMCTFLPLQQALRCAEFSTAWQAICRQPAALTSPLQLKVWQSAFRTGEDAGCSAFSALQGLAERGCLSNISTVQLLGSHSRFNDILRTLPNLQHLIIALGSRAPDERSWICESGESQMSDIARHVSALACNLKTLKISGDLYDDPDARDVLTVPMPILTHATFEYLRMGLNDFVQLFQSRPLESVVVHGCSLDKAQAGVLKEGYEIQPKLIISRDSELDVTLTLLLSCNLDQMKELHLDPETDKRLQSKLKQRLPAAAVPPRGDLSDIIARAEAELFSDLRRAKKARTERANPWQRLERWLQSSVRKIQPDIILYTPS